MGITIIQDFFELCRVFLVQFGIAGEPQKYREWRDKGIIQDDPAGNPFKRGYISYAGSGPNSRQTEVFVAYQDSASFGKPGSPWEVPFGEVKNMHILDKLYSGYGDVNPFGTGPSQQYIYERGNEYLREQFPLLDYILRCSIQEKKIDSNIDVSDIDVSTNDNHLFPGELWWAFSILGVIGIGWWCYKSHNKQVLYRR